jgi:DNA polymerase-3 subunit delta'
MRLCYNNDLAKTLEFVGEIGKLGREKQKNFLAYAERIIRNVLLINYKNPHLASLNQEEKEFLAKFGKFINHMNILSFTEELEKSQYHIERNANPNILFMDLSMTITILLMTAGKTETKS